MKKTVLLLAGLLCTGTLARAQWVAQPIGFRFDATPAYLDAVDANVAWAADFDYLNGIGDRQVARTTDGGTTWTVVTIPTLVDGQGITGIVGLSATTALISVVDGNQGGGSILKTTDGGATWTVRTNAAQFADPRSYPDMITFFNATDGVCLGDHLPGDRSYEIYRTTDAGTTWTRVADAALPPTVTDEFGPYTILGHQIGASVVGNTLWYPTSEGRVFKSADKGLTWTVSDTGLGTDIQSVAFRDAANGLAVAIDGSGGPSHALVRTTDGGTTWQLVNFTGPLHPLALDNVPGTSQYLSVGSDFSGLGGTNDAGSSYSRDNGQTWINLENTRSHTALDVAAPTVAWSAALDAATGQGLGVYKLTSTALAAAKDVALQRGLSVFPNPSTDGRFTVKLAALPAEAQLLVFDALGRTVRTQPLTTAALALDLSQQPAGVYTLQIRTGAGTAQQKLVIK
jgi:photosystem II stability/assembly factor-like uncharacterized protein